MLNGKNIKQLYSARHLTPKNRVILARSHRRLSEQLVVLKAVNEQEGYPGRGRKQKTFFRDGWTQSVQAR